MRRGANILMTTAALAAAGCAPGAGMVEVRPIADPAAKLKLGGPHLAQARAQLALGNVGLALEAFRVASREQPASTDALAGLAACYSAMGRFDLARQYYEAALAIAPSDPALLTALAASLDAQGMRAEAAEVRSEVAQLQSASAALSAPDPEPAVVQAAPPRQAVKVAAATPVLATPPIVQAKPVVLARPVVQAAPVVLARPVIQAMPAGPTITVKLPPARPVQALPAAAPAPRAPLQLPRAVVDVRSEPLPASAEAPLRVVAQAASVTLALPPARPVQAPVAPVPPRALLHLQPAIVVIRSAPSPRLERMSPGVVALITSQAPTAWRPQVVARTAQATTVRWVPLREASRPNIRLLNAARNQGLAARTRGYLLDRGWRKIAIGDASETRATSVVFYPSHRQGTARSLAAQFGFRAIQATKGNELVVMLGRDASARRALQTRG